MMKLMTLMTTCWKERVVLSKLRKNPQTTIIMKIRNEPEKSGKIGKTIFYAGGY